MGWRLTVYFSDGTQEDDPEVFETREEAEAEQDMWLEGRYAGAEVLRLANEDYSDAKIEGFEVWEE